MKSITKRIISTLAICGALVLEAGATAIGSLGKALNNIAKVDAADTTLTWSGIKSDNAYGMPTTASTTEAVNNNFNGLKVKYNDLKVNSGYFMVNSNDGYIYNYEAVAGSIKSLKVTFNTGTPSTAAKCKVSLGKTAAHPCTGTSKEVAQSAGGSVEVTDTGSNGYSFFAIESTVSKKNLQLAKIELTYAPKTSDGYTVSFDANGGSGSQDDLTSETSGTFTLPAATTFDAPEGKTFDGWGTGTASSTKITTSQWTIPESGKTATLYALWKDVEYTDIPAGDYSVTFNASEDAVPNGNFAIKEDTGSTYYRPLKISSSNCEIKYSPQEYVYAKSTGILDISTESNAIITSVVADYYMTASGTFSNGTSTITPVSGGNPPTSNGNAYTFNVNSKHFTATAGSQYTIAIYSFIVNLKVESAAGPTDVINEIDALPAAAYTQEFADKLNSALEHYNKLSASDQALVTNHNKLLTAQSSFNELRDAAVANVESLITQIGTVTADSGTKISAARTAYDALLADTLGKSLVSNYSTLTAAEATYQDAQAVKAVEDLINALPDAANIDDYSHHDDIAAARAAYEALSSTQKGMVSAALVSKLEACENAEKPFAPKEVTFYYSDTTTTKNMTGNNDAELLNADATKWEIKGDKGGNNNYPGLNKAGQIRLYSGASNGNTITIKTLITDAKITTLTLNFTDTTDSKFTNSVNVYAGSSTSTISPINGVYTINAVSVKIENASRSSDNLQNWFDSIVCAYSIPTSSTITYNNLKGATNSNPSTYVEGTGVASLVAPGSITGYTFQGWYDNASYDGNPITSIPTTKTGNVQLWAKWQINSHTYKIVYDNGTADATDTLNYGTTITIPAAPSKTGYEFLNWSDGTNTYNPGATTSMPDEDFTITAKYNVAKYTITFYKAVGEVFTTYTNKEYLSEIDLPSPAPTKEGFTFVGWAEDSSATEASWATGKYQVPAKNVDFYAVFTNAPAITGVTLANTFTSIELTEANNSFSATAEVSITPHSLDTTIDWSVFPTDAGTLTNNSTNSGVSPIFTASKLYDEVTITATSHGDDNYYKSFTFAIVNPVDEYVSDIVINEGSGVRKAYYSSETAVDMTGLTADATYKSTARPLYEDTRDVTSSATWTLDIANKKVIASLGGKTDYIAIEVIEDVITEISVDDNTGKREYAIGDEFDYSEVTVTGSYNNPAKADENVTSDCVFDDSAFDSLHEGTYTINVSYKNSETIVDSYTVEVKKATTEKAGWYLVTDASALKSGDSIIIVGIEGEAYYSLAPWVSGNNCKRNEIATPEDGYIDGECIGLTLGGAAGAWTIFDGTYYLYAAGGTGSNYLKGQTTAPSDTGKWTIECAADGVATIKCVDSSTTKNWLRHNTGSDLFSCYDKGQANVYIYKYKAGSTPSIVGIDAIYSGATTEGTVINNTDSTITFNTITNTGISDEIKDPGNVTLNGGDSVTLAAGLNEIELSYTVGDDTYKGTLKINATAVTKYDLSVSIDADEAEYSVSPAITDNKLIGGNDYTITVSAKEGYVIESVTATGATVSGNTVTITNASSDVSITVSSRALAMFGITDSTDEYVTLVNTDTQVKEGTTYESDLTFATGKELDTVSVTMGGVEVTGAYNNGHIKVENVSGDLVISITSKDVYFDVEYNFNHVSGVAISPETALPEKIVYNGTVSFKVEPESGYGVDTGHIMVKEDGAAKTFSYDSTTGILTVSNVTNALEIAIDAFELADVTKDLGDGLSISHESSPVSINNSYTLELSLADGKEITSVSVKMGGELVDDAWDASTLTVYIPTVTDDIEIKIETKTIQIPINANGNITVDPEVKDYGSESVTVTVSPKEGYVITENSLYYTIGDDDTHHTITGNSFVIDSLTEEINVYGETIAVYNLSYDLTDLTHSEADPYIEKDLDTFEIVLEVDGDKSVYGIDMTTFKVEMGGEDITGDITKVVYTYDKANGKLTIELVVSELTGDIKVTAARGDRLFDVSVTGQTDLVDVTGDLEIAYDTTGSITFTPADHYHFEANGIQVVNSGSAEVLLDSQLDGSVILYFLTGVKGDVSITVAVVHDLVSVTTGTLEHITFDFTTVEHENIEYGTTVTGHFTAEFGYERPTSITVTCYGELLEKTDYAYNKDTGVFSINAMGDIVISAKGTQGQVEVVATGDEHVSFNDGDGLPAITDSGLPFIATVEAEEGYKISSIVVTMNGSVVPNAYNEATGTITIQSVNDKINIAVTTVKLHSVEYDIENVTISDHIYEVVDNGTYSLIILVDEGYELTEGAVSVIMGGEDITDDVLGVGTIFISEVTGDVEVSIKATKKSFSVTNTLTNASNSSAAITSVEYGASYQAVISAVTGYENLSVTVKMGGVDVPCVNGVIIISKVTGAIEIEASAVASKVNVSVDVTNVTCTIDSQQVDYNSSLEFKLTQNDDTFDYVYSVTMGGEPVDGLNGVYTIEHVTGEVVIEASATIIELESITASLEYPYNLIDYDSDFPMEWLEVIAHYNNGDSQEVTSGITIEGFERTVSGEQTITVKALGLETTVDVEVLESTIVVNVSANTVEESYDFGYEFTKFDVDVHIEMSDGITYVVVPDDISGYDITKSGEQSITVYCGVYELQITVKINASTEIESISAVANKDNLTYGDTFNASDVTVTAKYTDGLTEEISAEYVEFLGAPGKNTVVVHAAGKTCTVDVTVKPSEVIDHIDALPNDISYAYGYELKASDFAVTATYTDGHEGTVDATAVVAEDLVPGLNVVVVKVGELSCNVVVKVDDSTEIDSISAVIKDGKDTVAYEGAFTADDVTVYATYTDGKTKVVTGFTMSGFDNKHIGVNTVTITLDGKTCTVKVTVLASTVVDHIEATATKDNLTYGDAFTKDDVKVTEVYTDGHKVENLAADSISGFTGEVGVNNVTVVYGGKEAAIQVTVKPSEVIESIEAAVNEGKAELDYGAAFTKDDVTVTATYTDGHTAVVAADSVDFAGTVGENTVVVHVGDKTCEVKVTVKPSEVITGIEASTEKVDVQYGTAFTKDDVKAVYVYSDGHKVDAVVSSISGFNSTQLGKQTITVKVGEYETTIEITVSGRVVLSIEAIGYNQYVDQGKEYNFDGKVIAHYNDNTSEEVSGYTVEKVDTTGHGPQTVKVSYEGRSVEITINVIQTKTDTSPTAMTAIIGGSVVGVAILAVGIFFLLKSFKI